VIISNPPYGERLLDDEVVTGNFAIPHKQFIENLKKI